MTKKIVYRSILAVALVAYLIFVTPSQVSTVVKYFTLKGKVNTLNLELQALAGSLMPAKDIHVVIKNSGCNIKLSSIMDSINPNDVKPYDGEGLDTASSKLLEYIIEVNREDVSYLLSYLSGYKISYSSIVLSDRELVLKIYCN